MAYPEPMSNPSKSSESSNSVWYIFLTSDCNSREIVWQSTVKGDLTYFAKQGRVGRVRIRVEMGVDNYVTTLTLTTRGTNTFLFFGEEDSQLYSKLMLFL